MNDCKAIAIIFASLAGTVCIYQSDSFFSEAGADCQ